MTPFADDAMSRPLFEEPGPHIERIDAWSGPLGFLLGGMSEASPGTSPVGACLCIPTIGPPSAGIGAPAWIKCQAFRFSRSGKLRHGGRKDFGVESARRRGVQADQLESASGFMLLAAVCDGLPRRGISALRPRSALKLKLRGFGPHL